MALQARDEFLSSAAHDLKNPLSSVVLTAQLMQRRLNNLERPRPQDIQAAFAAVEAAAGRMLGLINELLDAASIQSGVSLDLDRRPVDLYDLVLRVVAELQAVVPRHRLAVNGPDNPLICNCDATRVERVIRNLLDNAIKYSPAGGAVDVTIGTFEQDGRDWASIAIRDEGVGIPAGDLDLIFERFHRASNVRSLIGGTGLGLSGAKRIIEAHGGRIHVESSPNQGSVFTIQLPLDRAEEIPSAAVTTGGE
jgi:signal transduction histidine kinase